MPLSIVRERVYDFFMRSLATQHARVSKYIIQILQALFKIYGKILKRYKCTLSGTRFMYNFPSYFCSSKRITSITRIRIYCGPICLEVLVKHFTYFVSFLI